MKKRSILFILMSLVLLCTTLIFIPFEKIYAQEDDYTLISVSPTKTELAADGTNHACADGDKIYFQINGTPSMKGTATIYYSTYDGSAVAAAGDYREASGQVTISASKYTAMVGVEVFTTQYALSDKTSGKEKITTREFGFAIIDVDYEYGDINPDTADFTCNMKYKSLYQISSKNGTNIGDIKYMSEYNNTITDRRNMSVDNKDIDYEYNIFGNGGHSAKWYNDYISTGLAGAYVGFESYQLYDKGPSAADLWLTILRRSDSAYLYRHTYDFSRFKNTDITYADQLSYRYGGDCRIESYGHTEKTVGITRSDGSSMDAKMANIPVSSASELIFNFKFDNDDWAASIYRVWDNLVFDLALRDYTAPQFVKAYADTTHYEANGGSIRLAIRFSEPVQNVGGVNKLKVQILGQNYLMTYAGGAGSDTLYYELHNSEIKSSTKISQLYIIGFDESSSYVYDYAYNPGSKDSCISNQFTKDGSFGADGPLKVDINLHNPDVTVTTDQPSKPSATRNIGVEISSCTKGTLYYLWSESDTKLFNPNASRETSGDLNAMSIKAMVEEANFKSSRIRAESGSSTTTVAASDNDNNLLNGEYYLHLFVLSANGRYNYTVVGDGTERNASTIKPFLFDSTAPTITDFKREVKKDDGTLSKTFTANITDSPNYTGLGVSKILLSAKEAYGDTKVLELYASEKSSNIGSFDSSDPSKFSFTILASDLFEEETYKKYSFTISVIDTCDNESSQTINNLEYDTRPLFEVNTKTKDYAIYTTDSNEYAYKLNDSLYFEYQLSSSELTATNEFKIGELNYCGNIFDEKSFYNNEGVLALSSEVSKYVNVSYVSSTYTYKVYPLVSGNMSIKFTLNSSRVSETFKYYFSKNFDDATVNYTNILNRNYVKSYVYQLESSKYIYLEEDWKLGTQTKQYNDSSYVQSFSSRTKALSYVKYYEYQDLYLLFLGENSSTIISALNKGGESEFSKERNETVSAAKGQYWIRYKISTWRTTAEPSSWVYYYYGTGDEYSTINISSLPKRLTDAIDSVSEYITGLGGYTYLTSEDKVDGNYSINLKPEQLQLENKSVTQTFSGSNFSSPISYYKDENIYSNDYIPYQYSADETEIVFQNTEGVKFLMHQILTISPETRLYYAPINKSDLLSLDYVEILDADGKELDNYFGSNISGTYAIMEMDKNGVSVFKIRVDKEAPKLYYTFQATESSASEPDFLDNTMDGRTIGVKSFVIDKFANNEDDTWSYVTIYTKSTGTVFASYTMADLLVNEVSLPDGSFYVVVGDRYGNHYTITVNVNSSALSVDIIVRNGTALQVDVNDRSEAEIYRYEVYLNSQLVTSVYQQSNSFKESGYYRIYVQDIYGNVFDNYGDGKGVYFKRVAPEITWKYIKDGAYVTYVDGKEDQYMAISQASEYQYYLTTSTDLQFLYDDKLDFKFDVDIKYNKVDGSPTRVLVPSDEEWTLTIWYEDYPDVSVTYICTFDVNPPTITASYDIKNYELVDTDRLNSISANYTEENKQLEAESILFKSIETRKTYFKSGSTIQANAITVNISDNNGVKYYEVKLNGERYGEIVYAVNGEVDPLVLTEFGSYVITACDIFDNKTSFTFNNQATNDTIQIVDEKETTNETAYGNESYVLKITESGTLLLKIKTDKGTDIYSFTISNNTDISKIKVSRSIYVTMKGNDGLMSWGSTYITDLINENSKINEWYSLMDLMTIYKNSEINQSTTAEDDRTAQVKYDITDINDFLVMFDGQSFYFKINTGERVEINASYVSDNGFDVAYFSSVLSTLPTDVTIINAAGEVIVTNHNDNLTMIHSSFSIPQNLISDEVERIRICYSKTLDFMNFTTIYSNHNLIGYSTERDGFYAVTIYNVFGNQVSYYFSKSNSMVTTTDVTYADGVKVSYGNNYNTMIYSNSSVRITLLGSEGAFSVNFNGVDLSPSTYKIVSENNMLYVEFTQQGEYSVVVSDEYGNTRVKKFEIYYEDIKMDDDIIYGFNSNALLKNQYYTNYKLSINYKQFDINNVAYVSITKGENKVVVFDLLSETPVYASDNLLQCIGLDGDGDYTVLFRDIYGNKDERIIHYRETPTLSIAKNSRSDVTFNDVTIEEANAAGVWSNNTIKLTTDAQKFVWYIKNESGKTEYIKTNEKKFAFDANTEDGRYEYVISYVDEYGNTYEFNVYLLRQEIDVDLADDIEYTLINGIPTTKSNINIECTNDTYVFYSKNGEGEYYYDISNPSGRLNGDGEYRFTVTDRAGNSKNFTVIKDTTCEYSFTYGESQKELINGAAVNNDKVKFRTINGDTCYMYLVLHDGEVYDIGEDISFTEQGKWEVFVRDQMENESYFSFYIILHSMKEFTYVVPYNYEITEIWQKSMTGKRYTWMEYVDVLNGFTISTDGTYTVTLTNRSKKDSSVITDDVTYKFEFIINNDAPNVTLKGVEAGGTTSKTVTISGLLAGDTVTIYRDGSKVKTYEVESNGDSPTINEGGNYTLVVTNAAGVSTTLQFNKLKLTNTAGSVMIVIVIGAAALGLFVGLMLRKRSKVDK